MFGLPEIAVSSCAFDHNPRVAIETIASLGVRGVALDVSVPDLRPRNLSRSARRDIAALLRRAELELTGLDLWIPPEHLSHPAHSARAIEAAQQALEMSSELAPLVGGRSRPLVSLVLPSDLSRTARVALGEFAQHIGATLADHLIMRDDDEQAEPVAGIGVGVDPVYYLMDGQSPGKAITRAGARLASARLCDTSAMGRCVVGAQGSKLDLASYTGALIVSGQPWVTIDARDLPDPVEATRQACQRWQDAGTI